MEQKFTSVIIDDEQHARKLLSGMIGTLAPDVLIAAESENLADGVKAIRRIKPDLVFLDIEMPGHSGLELLDFFNDDEITFDIIFTTAYSNYAIQAFKLSAIDYILKPIAEDELTNAIERFRKKHDAKNQALDYAVLRENLQRTNPARIAVPSGNSIKFIDIGNILFLKGDGSYTEMNFTDGTKLVVSRTLKNFEDIVESHACLCRCHKSFVVNTDHIKEYVKADGGYLLMKDNQQVSVSPDRLDDILRRIDFISR